MLYTENRYTIVYCPTTIDKLTLVLAGFYKSGYRKYVKYSWKYEKYGKYYNLIITGELYLVGCIKKYIDNYLKEYFDNK